MGPGGAAFIRSGYSSQIAIDDPVTTLLHYSRKVVRLAFRETPLTSSQI